MQQEAIEYLTNQKILFQVKNNGVHLIVDGPNGFIDYWPTTGKWVDRTTKTVGQGVNRLVNFITGN